MADVKVKINMRTCCKFISILLCFAACYGIGSDKPNIVFVLTDDQDVTMGGQTPMAKTKKLVGEAGIIFNNMFVTSPLCCPSRSSILTGKYVHNHKAENNTVSGGCSSPQWQKTQEPVAIPTYMKNKGYTTFFAGKYLNQYGFPRAGGVEHIPPGWDNWYGLVGNSVYYNYSLSVNGKKEKHGDTYPQDYLTDVIHKRARQFLDSRHKWSDPFFMMLSTPACHAPFTPAPQYNTSFSNMTAPRNGTYNVKPVNKHWLIQQTIVPMPADTVKTLDDKFRNRWRTLLSVDDMVEDIINTLNKYGILDNTYIFFSSDNGYHLGQFGLPYDKRQLYDFDIRVPLMVRGPGIAAGGISHEPVLNIDLGPTFLSLIGETMPEADGISFKDILHPQENGTKPVRGTFLIEHSGEYSDSIEGCPQYDNQDMNNCNNHCVCEDSKNNTFACLVQMSANTKTCMKYCEFQDSAEFVEIYDTAADPYEKNNLFKQTDPKTIAHLEKQLQFLATCSGPACHSIPT